MIVKYQNKVVSNNSKWVGYSGEPGPGPEPQLPAYTLRLKFIDGVTPTFDKGTGVLFDSTNNIWDLTYDNSSWNDLLQSQRDLLEVIDGNTSSVTDMSYMFAGCWALTSVSLFDTSNVTNMTYMFRSCTSLTSIPLFDTSKLTNMDSAFYVCRGVQSGALALYQQVSTQTNPPTSHRSTFYNCGSNTQTGAAELAQIPSDWK